MAKNIEIELCRTAYQTKIVIIQVPDSFETWDSKRQQAALSAIYSADEEACGDGDGYEEQSADEEKHCVCGKSPRNETPEYVINDNLEAEVYEEPDDEED